jgi:hypothetical protein
VRHVGLGEGRVEAREGVAPRHRLAAPRADLDERLRDRGHELDERPLDGADQDEVAGGIGAAGEHDQQHQGAAAGVGRHVGAGASLPATAQQCACRRARPPKRRGGVAAPKIRADGFSALRSGPRRGCRPPAGHPAAPAWTRGAAVCERQRMAGVPRPPVSVVPAFDDPAAVERLIEAHAPYWPVQRYFANDAEYAALSGEHEAARMIVAPVFRGNWATEGAAARGVEPLLRHPRFVDAARRLFDAEIVRPFHVYVNLTWQLPFPQGAGHTDIPAFRGFDRSRYPITFLSIMGLSGLFEDVRLKIATAVAWLYRGADGGFEYWPEGPDRPPVAHEGAIDNTAIVGDNDFMWHRVRPTGRPEDGMVSLGLDSELMRVAGGWAIADGGRTLASFAREEMRVSVSWKALVFESDADRRRCDEHLDDIGLEEVLRRFVRDLEGRGVGVEPPADPLRDPGFIGLLRRTYVRTPSVFG